MKLKRTLLNLCGIHEEGVNLCRLKDEGFEYMAMTLDHLEVYRKGDNYLVYDSRTDKIVRQVKTR